MDFQFRLCKVTILARIFLSQVKGSSPDSSNSSVARSVGTFDEMLLSNLGQGSLRPEERGWLITYLPSLKSTVVGRALFRVRADVKMLLRSRKTNEETRRDPQRGVCCAGEFFSGGGTRKNKNEVIEYKSRSACTYVCVVVFPFAIRSALDYGDLKQLLLQREWEGIRFS